MKFKELFFLKWTCESNKNLKELCVQENNVVCFTL